MDVFKASTDAVVSFGNDFRILTLNPRTEALFAKYRGAPGRVARVEPATRPSA
jgi:hypothetical protein